MKDDRHKAALKRIEDRKKAAAAENDRQGAGEYRWMMLIIHTINNKQHQQQSHYAHKKCARYIQ